MQVARPCKVYHPGSRQYLPARTVDYSPVGAMIEVLHDRPLPPGERVDVLIAWSHRTLLSAADHVPGTVVRAIAGERRLIAVDFTATGAAAAARAA